MSQRYKLIVNVPVTHADAVREAMAAAGAGRYGAYSHCSFSLRGTGRFMPGPEAKPYLGERGKLETVEEEQIQVDVQHEDMKAVLSAMKQAHPYEVIGHEIHLLVDEGIF
jgi:hypothetical protein